MAPNEPPDPDSFGPDDPREPGDWNTRYQGALKYIYGEAAYLLFVLAADLFLLATLFCGPTPQWCVSRLGQEATLRYLVAGLGGVLGGTLFAMKWLYHTVAKQLWHRDRLLWRLFTPIISGGLAFVTIAMFSSLKLFDAELVRRPPGALSVAFLVGFFSDSALAKMAEIAEVVLGRKPRS